MTPTATAFDLIGSPMGGCDFGANRKETHLSWELAALPRSSITERPSHPRTQPSSNVLSITIGVGPKEPLSSYRCIREPRLACSTLVTVRGEAFHAQSQKHILAL